jgi:hypothetical protein
MLNINHCALLKLFYAETNMKKSENCRMIVRFFLEPCALSPAPGPPFCRAEAFVKAEALLTSIALAAEVGDGGCLPRTLK